MTLKERVQEIKDHLARIEYLAEELRKEEVVLTFIISSEKKTVEVQSVSILEISCKATVNQEL